MSDDYCPSCNGFEQQLTEAHARADRAESRIAALEKELEGERGAHATARISAFRDIRSRATAFAKREWRAETAEVNKPYSIARSDAMMDFMDEIDDLIRAEPVAPPASDRAAEMKPTDDGERR